MSEGGGMMVGDLFARLGLRPDKHAFKEGSELLEKVKHGLEALAIYEGIEWIHKAVDGVAEYAEGIERAAQKTGVATDQLQRLGYAAKITGSSQEAVVNGMTKLSRTLAAAKGGSKASVQALKDVGVSMHDPAVKAGDLNEVFLKISDHLAAMPNGWKKNALAQKLFSRSGADLLPTLNEGRKGLQEMGDEAEGFGDVIDEHGIHSLVDFEHQQKRIGAAWDGLKNTAVQALLPALKDLTDRALKWLKANKDWLALKVQQVFGALVTVASAVGTAIGLIVDGMQWLTNNTDILIAGLAGLVAGMLLYKAAAIETAIESAIAWVAAAAPFIAIGLVVAGIIILVKKYRKQIKAVFDEVARDARYLWEQFTSALQSIEDGIDHAGEWIKKTFQEAIDFAIHKFEDLGNKIETLPGIKQAIKAYDYVHGAVAGVMNNAAAFAKPGGPTTEDAVKIAQDYQANGGYDAKHLGGASAKDMISKTVNMTNTITVNAGAAAADVEPVIRKVFDDWTRDADHSAGEE